MLQNNIISNSQGILLKIYFSYNYIQFITHRNSFPLTISTLLSSVCTLPDPYKTSALGLGLDFIPAINHDMLQDDTLLVESSYYKIEITNKGTRDWNAGLSMGSSPVQVACYRLFGSELDAVMGRSSTQLFVRASALCT